jgi:abscisate beta-glucosyltransferase
MESEGAPGVLEIFFFPFVGGGHQIPMIDTARVFASHGVKSTIIATPTTATQFQNSILRDQQIGRQISIHGLRLPEGAVPPDTDLSAVGSTDTSVLQEPLRLFLLDRRPDCIVVDLFHRWAAELIDGLRIRRIDFTGSGIFSRCVMENVKNAPHEKLGSDYEPFLVPGLPDRIKLTRSQLPPFSRGKSGPFNKLGKGEEMSFGSLINSFYDLEPAYVEYFRKEMGKKAWIIGPVSLYNRNVADKADRGQQASIDGQSCLKWLDDKEPDSVLYVSFGSLGRFSAQQLIEMAHGLEASNHPFIWVVGKIFTKSEGTREEEENWLPDGFEERIKESKKGLIIRGWAPQLLILEHPAVGAFMTHCGWNSTLEGVSSGVPMITWPVAAEQFFNEKLLTDVLGIGVQVGSLDWISANVEKKALVGREKVEVAVKRLMDGDGDGAEAGGMRRRARELAEKAKRAVEEGGSSDKDVNALIEELKSCGKDN